MNDYPFPFRKLLDDYFGVMEIDFINRPNDFSLPSCGLMTVAHSNVYIKNEDIEHHKKLLKMWLATEEVWPDDYHIAATSFTSQSGRSVIGVYFTNEEAYTMMKLKYG